MKSVARQTPPRHTLLAGGRATLASPLSNTAGRFSRLTEQDLRNPHLSARERVRHTRFSSLAHGLVSSCLEDLNAAVPHQRIGVVTASMYGCIEETNTTREAYRAGGMGGVDPVQFSKSTHSYLANALSIAWGLRGPVSSLLGRRDATLEALWFASTLIEERLADAMFVVAFDEIGDCARRHLDAGGGQTALVGEACVVLCLVGSHCMPAATPAGGWRLSRLAAGAAGTVGAHVVAADAAPGAVDYLSANAAVRLLDWVGNTSGNPPGDGPRPSLELVGSGDRRAQPGLAHRLCLQRVGVPS